jgi:hypothetical protein
MMKLHIEVPDELVQPLLAEALKEAGLAVRAQAEKNDGLRRALIRDAIIRRLSQ